MPKDKDVSKDVNQQVSETEDIKTQETQQEDEVTELKPNYKFKFDWDKLKIYLVVAREGSINAAAAKLGLKQSTVSRAISTLERQLGLKLFRRDNTGSHITEEGELMLILAQDMELKSNRTGNLLYEMNNKPDAEIEGKVRVGVQGFFGSTWLSRNLKEFHERYPKLTLETKSVHPFKGDLDDIIRDVDAIIRAGSSKKLDLLQQKIYTGKFLICTTQKYIDKYGIPKDLDDLDNHRLIVVGDMLLKLGCAPGGAQRTPKFRADNPHSMLNSILDGNGIAILPSYLLSSYPELIPILEEVETPTYDLYFCYPPELKLSKKLRLFHKYLLEKIKTMPR